MFLYFRRWEYIDLHVVISRTWCISFFIKVQMLTVNFSIRYTGANRMKLCVNKFSTKHSMVISNKFRSILPKWCTCSDKLKPILQKWCTHSDKLKPILQKWRTNSVNFIPILQKWWTNSDKFTPTFQQLCNNCSTKHTFTRKAMHLVSVCENIEIMFVEVFRLTDWVDWTSNTIIN